MTTLAATALPRPGDLLAAPRLPVLLLIGLAVAALGAALFAEHVGGLRPCELCLWQRWAFAAAIDVLLPALGLAERPRTRAPVLAAGGLAFLAGAGIAFFHAGVEQHWWPGLQACGATVGQGARTAADLLAQLQAAPVIRCDEIPWSFLGLSMAAWNVPFSLGLAGVAFAAAAATWTRPTAAAEG